MSGEETQLDTTSESYTQDEGLAPGARKLLKEYVDIIEHILENEENKSEEEWGPEFRRLGEIEEELKEDYGIVFGADSD